MAAGGSDPSGRQARHLETIDELEESESELSVDSVLLGVRRRGRVSLVKQSTPARSEESRFTVSGSGDSLASWPQRAPHSRDPPHALLPSLQEAEDTPAGSDPSPSLSSPLHPQPAQRPLSPGGPSAAAVSPGQSSPLSNEDDSKDKDWPEPKKSRRRKKRRPNRRLSMRSEDGEEPAMPLKKKTGRKPRKNAKMTSEDVPEWLATLMHSIEEATHHELVVEQRRTAKQGHEAPESAWAK
ncbi:coiled-coil domain-containing protein 201-like [Conger conger]|uniref:coiled-coil domain-containing protein 201-like n=1 Tax=Conger conger TaxID=82655 RepID=UPI002A59A737|nr:coiled-coil domain-containing protein 201-like [Conger conger]XP_061110793.1 coiled-coil domain-containing protein 201-like [Conger conger]XP_061110794.1 coiled-coil domain-containing protein 201-like [Conger conger]